jgi:hypothetical protein
LIAEGAWSETFAETPDDMRGMFHNAADYAASHPDETPTRALVLSAPRPEHGVALDAALRPVVAHTSASLSPGPLRGFIDHIEAPRLIEGWAQDIDHPELPVLLEAVLDDRVIGTVLVCHHRPDLALAGIGQALRVQNSHDRGFAGSLAGQAADQACRRSGQIVHDAGMPRAG